MTADEARYWLAQLHQMLCQIKQSNIKYVRLNSDDYSEHAMADEGKFVYPRHQPFKESDWFDVKKITTLNLGGYLPIPRCVPAQRRLEYAGPFHIRTLVRKGGIYPTSLLTHLTLVNADSCYLQVPRSWSLSAAKRW